MIQYMNPFNDVLQAIKKHCGDTNIIEGPACFETIAMESTISLNRLELYLGILQDLELIKYSTANYSIQITALGQQKKELFTA